MLTVGNIITIGNANPSDIYLGSVPKERVKKVETERQSEVKTQKANSQEEIMILEN